MASPRSCRLLIGRAATALAAVLLVVSVAAAPGADRPGGESPAAGTVGPERASVEDLARRLVGTFTTARQAEEVDGYASIRLVTARIWPAREDGPWLYVEQAAAGSLDRPYRQRVYRLARDDDPQGTFRIEVFSLPRDGANLVGAWRDPLRFNDLAPADLSRRQGCDVFLLYDPQHDAYAGGTRGRGCESRLRGASHVTSDVRLYRDRLDSLDRGFDVDGVQVWGPERGPYIFRRAD